jgi:hypothetical protein
MRRLAAILLLSALVPVACKEIGGLGPGDLRLVVVTTGGDFDLLGYGVSVNGVHRQSVDLNGSILLRGLEPGVHEVELTGMAENCSKGVTVVQSVRHHASGASLEDVEPEIGTGKEWNIQSDQRDPVAHLRQATLLRR